MRAGALSRVKDLILRSLRSKRLEGWLQTQESSPSFETREDALLRMRSEILFPNPYGGRSRAAIHASAR
jgi:hypothetical protein